MHEYVPAYLKYVIVIVITVFVAVTVIAVLVIVRVIEGHKDISECSTIPI